MNYESGFGANGSPYEYEVAVAKNAKIVLKRFCLCLLYVSWVVGFIVLGSVIRLIWPFLAFIPLSLWVIVYLTWKYTQISYRYSFFGGEMKVERLLGGRKNQPILSVKIKDLIAIYRCDGSEAEKLDQFSADETVFAASSDKAYNLTVVFYVNEKNEKTALYFEADENAMRILRYYNKSAVDAK